MSNKAAELHNKLKRNRFDILWPHKVDAAKCCAVVLARQCMVFIRAFTEKQTNKKTSWLMKPTYASTKTKTISYMLWSTVGNCRCCNSLWVCFPHYTLL